MWLLLLLLLLIAFQYNRLPFDITHSCFTEFLVEFLSPVMKIQTFSPLEIYCSNLLSFEMHLAVHLHSVVQ